MRIPDYWTREAEKMREVLQDNKLTYEEFQCLSPFKQEELENALNGGLNFGVGEYLDLSTGVIKKEDKVVLPEFETRGYKLKKGFYRIFSHRHKYQEMLDNERKVKAEVIQAKREKAEAAHPDLVEERTKLNGLLNEKGGLFNDSEYIINQLTLIEKTADGWIDENTFSQLSKMSEYDDLKELAVFISSEIGKMNDLSYGSERIEGLKQELESLKAAGAIDDSSYKKSMNELNRRKKALNEKYDKKEISVNIKNAAKVLKLSYEIAMKANEAESQIIKQRLIDIDCDIYGYEKVNMNKVTVSNLKNHGYDINDPSHVRYWEMPDEYYEKMEESNYFEKKYKNKTASERFEPSKMYNILKLMSNQTEFPTDYAQEQWERYIELCRESGGIIGKNVLEKIASIQDEVIKVEFFRQFFDVLGQTIDPFKLDAILRGEYEYSDNPSSNELSLSSLSREIIEFY